MATLFNQMDYSQRSRAGPTVAYTASTADIKSEVDKFRNSFRAEIISDERKYRQIQNIDMFSNPSIMDIRVEVEHGFLVAVSESQLRNLIMAANEGVDHLTFRDTRPAARDLWEQYISLYNLTREHK